MQYKIPEKFNAIDSHTHLNFILGVNYNYLDKDEAARMIECNKKYGITKAGISMPYMKKNVTLEEYQKGNNLILEALNCFDHFFGFCFVRIEFYCGIFRCQLNITKINGSALFGNR